MTQIVILEKGPWCNFSGVIEKRGPNLSQWVTQLPRLVSTGGLGQLWLEKHQKHLLGHFCEYLWQLTGEFLGRNELAVRLKSQPREKIELGGCEVGRGLQGGVGRLAVGLRVSFEMYM